MGSFLARVVLGAGIAMVVSILSGQGVGHAQPGPGSSAPASTGARAAARKLVDEGIAAQDAKDYDRAIALYMRAFALDPHPLLLFNVGQAHRLAGCPQRAVPFYERYLALEPSGTQAPAAQAALAEIKRSQKPDGPACAKDSSADAPAESLPEIATISTGQLKLRSVPEGVTVMIDGTKVGVTPIERELATGPHTIALVDRGMLVGEREVEIGEGAVVEVTMPVVYLRDDRPHPPSRGPSRVLPVALFVVGGLGIGGGVFGLYLGQKGGHEDRYVYEGATPAGIAGLAAGAAAIGAGVWFWVRGSRESAPVALASPGGGYLGWQGRF